MQAIWRRELGIFGSGDIFRWRKGFCKIAIGSLLLGTVPDRVFAAPIELDYMEYSSDANARAAYVSNSSITATGGTITEVDGYRIHTFTSNGTFTIDVTTNVEVLVVAGGGGAGAMHQGSGGGAGGLIYNSAYSASGNITVTVGAGGAGSTAQTENQTSGNNSVFGTLTAIGGGRGGAENTDPYIGGSGGGGSHYYHYAGAAGTSGQGNAGGTVTGYNIAPFSSAGGGGAGGVGANVAINAATPGAGGTGAVYSISGSPITYAGGGAGSNRNSVVASGGSGGGGNSHQNGSPNTGGGGGGGNGTNIGGAGGSGIVIIRYPSPVLSYSEATIKTQGTYALKSTAPVTTSLNKTLTSAVSPTVKLSDMIEIKFDIRAVRTGSNIKIGIHDSGGTTTEITPDITSANNYQTVTWDISGVSNANKDVIDQIIVTIVNADAANSFYIDNMAVNPLSPPQATGVSGAVLGVSSITWNWTDNSSGQYQEDGFKVYCATSTELRNTSAIDAVTWTETGLTPNTTFKRYIQSYNTAGSNNSATATKVTLCKVPVSMTIASPSYTQLELNWDANGNPAGTKYIAHCSPDGFAMIHSSTVTATTATFNSLTRNTEYEVRVYAVNHAGVCTRYLGQYSRRTQPGTFQEKTTTRTGKNSYGFEGDGVWTWEVPANGGSAVTITAYAQYNSDYGGAAKPKFTLYNNGVNDDASMTVGAGAWEKLTVSGTPTGKGVLFLKVEGFSTAVGAKYFVDDIQVNQ